MYCNKCSSDMLEIYETGFTISPDWSHIKKFAEVIPLVYFANFECLNCQYKRGIMSDEFCMKFAYKNKINPGFWIRKQREVTKSLVSNIQKLYPKNSFKDIKSSVKSKEQLLKNLFKAKVQRTFGGKLTEEDLKCF